MIKKIMLMFPCTICLEMTAFAQPEKLFVNPKIHQEKYCLFIDDPGMPAGPDAVEDFDVEKFTARINDCGIGYLYLAPGKKYLPFKVADRCLNVPLPVNKGFSLLVFE